MESLINYHIYQQSSSAYITLQLSSPATNQVAGTEQTKSDNPLFIKLITPTKMKRKQLLLEHSGLILLGMILLYVIS